MSDEVHLIAADDSSVCVVLTPGVVQFNADWRDGPPASGLHGFHTVSCPGNLSALAISTTSGEDGGSERRTSFYATTTSGNVITIEVDSGSSSDGYWSSVGRVPEATPVRAMDLLKSTTDFEIFVAQQHGLYVAPSPQPGASTDLVWERISGTPPMRSISATSLGGTAAIVGVDHRGALGGTIRSPDGWHPWSPWFAANDPVGVAVSSRAVDGRLWILMTTPSSEAMLLEDRAGAAPTSTHLSVLPHRPPQTSAALLATPRPLVVAVGPDGQLMTRARMGDRWSGWSTTTGFGSPRPAVTRDLAPTADPARASFDHQGVEERLQYPSTVVGDVPRPTGPGEQWPDTGFAAESEQAASTSTRVDATRVDISHVDKSRVDATQPLNLSPTEHVEIELDETLIIGTDVDPLREGDPSRIGDYELQGRHRGGNDHTVKYRARHPAIGYIFLKVLSEVDHPDRQAVEEAMEREARNLQQLPRRHPNIVRFVELGKTDDGRPWIALKSLPGSALSDLPLRRRPFDEVVSFATQLLQGIEAHLRVGVVHCDLKPENVHVLPGGSPVVTDYGASVHLDEARLATRQLTRKWAAPELLDPGTGPGATTDLFGWALLVAQYATGRFPFPTFVADPAYGSGGTYTVRRDGSAPELDDAPVGLAQLLRACLVTDPTARPGVAQALGKLQAMAPREGSTEVTTVPAPLLGKQMTAISSLVDGHTREVRRRLDVFLMGAGNLPVPVHLFALAVMMAVALLLGRVSGQVLYGVVRG